VNDKYQTGIAKSPTDTIIHLQRNSVISPFLLIATDLCIYLSFFGVATVNMFSSVNQIMIKLLHKYFQQLCF